MVWFEGARILQTLLEERTDVEILGFCLMRQLLCCTRNEHHCLHLSTRSAVQDGTAEL